jgi:LacI family transcriptional regulator
MSITQKDIAEKLNVSVMTVSKALKGNPDISEDTRALVERTAREMHYTINVVARSLVQKRSNTIGVVVPDISESFYAEILRGIESVVRGQKYNMLLADSDNDPDQEINALQTMHEKRVEGLIFAPTEKSTTYLEILNRIGIPVVVINSNPVNLNCDTISIDRASGAFQSVAYLLDQGYQDIYFFYTYKHMEQSQQTIQGCHRAFVEHKKMDIDLHLIHCENRDLETFYSTTKECIRYQGRRIGLFVWDDEMAVACLRAVTEKNLQIPEQVGIIGFDDIKISKYLTKSLTTVFYPKFEMGRKGAERLIQRLNSKQPLPAEKIQLQLQFIKRETA